MYLRGPVCTQVDTHSAAMAEQGRPQASGEGNLLSTYCSCSFHTLGSGF